MTSSIIPSRLVLTGSEQKHYRLTSMKGGYSIASAEKKEVLVVPQMSALAVVVWWKVISVQVVNIEEDIGFAGNKAWVQITRMYHCRHNNQRKTLQRKTAFVFGHFLSAEEATVLRLCPDLSYSQDQAHAMKVTLIIQPHRIVVSPFHHQVSITIHSYENSFPLF